MFNNSTGSNNWNNSLIGNYWDDYRGVDQNDDGIGDTPYSINGTANSFDYLPIWDDGLEYEILGGEYFFMVIIILLIIIISILGILTYLYYQNKKMRRDKPLSRKRKKKSKIN